MLQLLKKKSEGRKKWEKGLDNSGHGGCPRDVFLVELETS
jgi:hypothetical protein